MLFQIKEKEEVQQTTQQVQEIGIKGFEMKKSLETEEDKEDNLNLSIISYISDDKSVTTLHNSLNISMIQDIHM